MCSRRPDRHASRARGVRSRHGFDAPGSAGTRCRAGGSRAGARRLRWGRRQGVVRRRRAITRPEYIKQVDAICKKTTQQSKPSFDKLQALIDASGTYKSRLIKGAPTLRRVYDLQASKFKRFKAIDPPDADRAQIAQITKAAQATLDEFEEFLPAADAGDLTKFIDIATDATGSRARVDRLGTTYGFRKDCFSLPLDLSDLQQ